MAVAYYYSSTAGEYSLTGAITSSATSIPLNSVTGLPAVPFKVVIDPGLPQEEIVKVSAVAGTTLTVTRGWDSSTAVSHSALAKVRHMMTAEDLRLSREHENATAAHGVGAVVGTSETQTLTNKNLTSGTNTFPSTLATDAELSAHTGATAVHGATGAVVGTTNTQTLSNKTLNAPIVTGDLTNSTGNVLIGSTTDTTQYMLRVRRLGTDAVSRDARFMISNDELALMHFKSGSLVNQMLLKNDGSTTLYGNLTVPGAATVGSVSSTGTITQGGKQVVSKDTHIQAGTVTVNISAAISGAGTITFPVAFAGTPVVTVTSRSSAYIVTTATGSASSIAITVRHVDSVVDTNTVTIAWIAVYV